MQYFNTDKPHGDKLHVDKPSRNFRKQYMWKYFTMKSGLVLQVIAYASASAIRVKFVESGKEVTATVAQIKAKCIKEPK
mgnify:CR=1 FL=1|tara:strand:+ start:381 stop:617 length:237 start_codon:yes stop_codon:yes gene_type:complete